MKKIRVRDAIGMVIPHDLTEIVPGGTKKPAFKKGHVIREEDIPHLERIGKNHIYVMELSPDDLHEDDAARLMAPAFAGPGIEFDPDPSEGKIAYSAADSGLFRVDVDALFRVNMLGDVMLSTLHSNTVVEKGGKVAAGRAIPLVVKRSVVRQAVSVARDAGGIISVVPFMIKRGALVITGREVYEGRIKDAFGPAMGRKFEKFGIEVVHSEIVPDDRQVITSSILRAIEKGAEMVLCTGGMSVDPDDVTRNAIRDAGVTGEVYGSPVLPGAMFMVSFLGKIPVLGIPACGMFFRTTVLDIVLPRVLAGEKIGRREIAALGHGGFCLGCRKCSWPVCPFGKGGV
jgi:hypothetical protein